ncbi:MAG: N-acetyltransferase [Promethearchaeota archaeon]|nr:MAG: N-acetyltransferase [Candidatus Lokiarchaeota archaeon]
MTRITRDSKIKIKFANKETFLDLNLCAKEFIDLLDNFKYNFLNKKYFVLTAYYDGVLAGLLVASDKSKKVDSLERMVPTMSLHLLFVNPIYRNKGIGIKLMNTFLMILKNRDFASIYIKLPKHYKKGINFFLNNRFLNRHFSQVEKTDNHIILEMNLWTDFGIKNCNLTELDERIKI